MSILRGLISGLAIVFAILVLVALIVVGLNKVIPQSPTATNFHAACAELKGNAVWNGRHWECLK